jgi:DNA-directed RNA polymerase specialized sigma24 family protein
VVEFFGSVSPGGGGGGIIRVVTVEEVDVAGSVEEAYVLYAQDLTRFATGLVGPWDAQDVVADAVMACVGSRHWSGAGDPRSYLYRAVLNRCRQ